MTPLGASQSVGVTEPASLAMLVFGAAGVLAAWLRSATNAA